MRLLARYLVRECLVALGFCFSAFLILWVALDLLSELNDLQEHKLRVADILAFYLFRVPEFLPVALPVAILLALLYAVSNHARHNEITAIRAAGVSLWRLCLPYFAIGLGATVLLFVSNEFCAPKAGEIADRILNRRLPVKPEERRQQITNFAFDNSRANRFWWMGTYYPQTGEILQPRVQWPSPDGSRNVLIADRGCLTNGFWTFYQVRELRQYIGTNAVRFPPTNMVVMTNFTETLEEIRSEISISDRYDHPTKTHRADVPIREIQEYRRLHPKLKPAIRAWLYTKLYGRFAGPCTCLVLVVLAVPFAAASGRRNVFVGVAASLVIFFAYFILQQVGFAFGEKGQIPAWLGAWFPNLFFGITGIWLMARVR